jgi:putative aldouronate transport system permease protein
MKVKQTLGEKIFYFFNTLFMIFMIIITLYPMLYVLFASVSDSDSIMKYTGPLLKPIGFTFAAYKRVFQNPMVSISFFNSVFIVVIGTTINIFMTSITAYILSRKNFYIKNFMMVIIVITMYFSGGLVPQYLNIRSLGMIDSYWALTLPVAISAYNMIIMRTAFLAIPDSLEESAKLDGARHIDILFKIILPLSLPTVAVMILFYGVGHWNSWFSAMIYIKTRDKFPMQLILREILILNDTAGAGMQQDTSIGDVEKIGETIKYALIIVSTMPILLIYPFLQKYFVNGVMIGALKG